MLALSEAAEENIEDISPSRTRALGSSAGVLMAQKEPLPTILWFNFVVVV